MIKKILIPLENVLFRGTDNKIRLRYRLKSKDANEVSQWSPIYTVNPSELGNSSVGTSTTNPILYSEWQPTSYSDGTNINIKIDNGWANDKKIIPCKNFDIFVSWNMADVGSYFSGYEISKTGNIKSGSVVATTEIIGGPITVYNYTAIVTDVPTKDLEVGGFISAKDGVTGKLGQSGGIETSTIITKIYGPYSMQVTTSTEGFDVPVVAGDITKVSKLEVEATPTTNNFVYLGTTGSGNIAIKIPQQVYSTNNVIQYVYRITPATNPPTLTDTNWLYDSGILTTIATVEPNSSGNTYNIDNVDGGSPS
jgi:hypothetical protein